MSCSRCRSGRARCDDLFAASEAFLASTIREVQSIGAVEDVEFPEGPRTREAAAAFRAHVEEELRVLGAPGQPGASG